MSSKANTLFFSLAACLWLLNAAGPVASDPADAEVYLRNQYGAKVEVFKIDASGNGRSVGSLEHGESMYLDTAVGRQWVLKTADKPRKEVMRFTVAKAEEERVVTNPNGASPATPETPATLTVINESDGVIELLEPARAGKGDHALIKPGGVRYQVTWLGTTWIVRRLSDRKELSRIKMTSVTHTATIESESAPPPAVETKPAILTVINQRGETVTLVRHLEGGKTRTHAVIKSGEAWEESTSIGTQWSVIPVGAKLPIHRFAMSKGEETMTLRKPGTPLPPPEGTDPLPFPEPGGAADQPGPPAPVAVERKIITASAHVNAIGVWQRVSGDSEMDTDWRDRVPVEVKSRLVHDATGVRLNLFFSCSEYGGDGTAYAGPRRTYDIATVANGKIEAGWRVVNVQPTGGPSAIFSTVSIGRQHGFQYLSTHGTFWSRLGYRVDGRGRGDGRVVGVRGTLSVKVVLER